MKQPTTKELIVDALGYCCPWLFFKLFPRPREASLRLGVSEHTVKAAKRKALEEGCGGCTKCHKDKITALEHAVRQRRDQWSDPRTTDPRAKKQHQ